MKNIVSPVPIHITIDYNELSGQSTMHISAPIPFLTLDLIFHELIVQMMKRGFNEGMLVIGRDKFQIKDLGGSNRGESADNPATKGN